MCTEEKCEGASKLVTYSSGARSNTNAHLSKFQQTNSPAR